MASVVWGTMCLALLFLPSFAKGDTPANCTYEEIRGPWIFFVGRGGFNNTVNCSNSFPVVSKLLLNLLFPDIAVDNNGNKGFWTLIYNQGFEVHINGRKYFAFSAYQKTGDTVVSFCDKTKNGWSHEGASYKPIDWACYYGMSPDLPKFPHNPIPCMQVIVNGNNGKNNAIAMGLCAVFVVFWWRNKGLHTLNRMHNEVWDCAEI